MAKLKILTGENNPFLRSEAVEVVKFDTSLKMLVKDMKETMIKAGGLGLAAPQVGKNLRMFIIILDYKMDSERVMAMVNPHIINRSDETELGEEGCLSLPGKYGKVERYRELTVEFYDVDGNRQILTVEGLAAREVQHENDHLDGVLFIDRLKKTGGKKEEEMVM